MRAGGSFGADLNQSRNPQSGCGRLHGRSFREYHGAYCHPDDSTGRLVFTIPSARLLLSVEQEIDRLACRFGWRDLGVVCLDRADSGIFGLAHPAGNAVQLDVPGIWNFHYRVRLHSLHGNGGALEASLLAGR